MATWLSPGIVLEPTARFSVLAIAGSRGYDAARFRRARGGRFTGLSRRRHDGEAVVVGEEEKEEREDEGEWRGEFSFVVLADTQVPSTLSGRGHV